MLAEKWKMAEIRESICVQQVQASSHVAILFLSLIFEVFFSSVPVALLFALTFDIFDIHVTLNLLHAPSVFFFLPWLIYYLSIRVSTLLFSTANLLASSLSSTSCPFAIAHRSLTLYVCFNVTHRE